MARTRPTGKNRWRYPGTYDPDRAARAVGIIHSLPHIKGKWAGTRIELLPFQRRIIEDVFGTINPDGSRQYRTVYVEIPRKNGKTTLLSAVGVVLLLGDDEHGAEIYSAAADRDQASIAFDIAKEMIQRTPVLAKRCIVRDYKKRIDVPGWGFYRAVEREAAGQHGWNASGVLFDELHVQRTPELFDVLSTSGGTRAQPLTFIITTAGFDRQSICWRMHHKARQILDGKIEDPTFYPVIYSAVDDDRKHEDVKWQSKKVWKKANPAFGKFRDPGEFESAALRAKQDPAFQNEFKRLYLNIWTQAESRLITTDAWDACADGSPEPELLGLPCHGGLDLAATRDIAAFALLVSRGEGRRELIMRFWCPEDTIRTRTHSDGVPYQMWADAGWITATPGNVIDFDYIEAEILGLAELYQINSLGYDRWQAAQIVQHLTQNGILCVPVGMGFAGMSDPTKEFQRSVLSKKLKHTANPVMDWMIDNLVAETDAAGNLKPSKNKSTEKIDGPVAAIIATDRMIRQPARAEWRAV